MNIRGNLIALAVAGGLATGRAANPVGTNAPSASTPTNPVQVVKQGGYAFGYGMAMTSGWPGRYYVTDMDPDDVARGVADALRGRRADGSTNMIPLAEAQKLWKAEVDLSTTNLLKKGLAYLADYKNKEGVVTLPDGLEYKILKQGAGASPKQTNSVLVNYIGRLANGCVFDSTFSDIPKPHGPVTLDMRAVVPGWAEAMTLMKPGGEMEVAIPAGLGYGPKGRRAIPPNATLIFWLQLLSVTNGPAPVTLNPPMQSPPPGARIMSGPPGSAPPPGAAAALPPGVGAVSPILQVNPDGTSQVLPPNATAPAPPLPAPKPAKP